MSTRKQTLLMLGDSLIEWGDWPELLFEYNIINRGRAGETVEGLAGRVFPEIESHGDYTSILIMSGTNNLLMGDTLFPLIFSSMLARIQLLIPKTTLIVNGLLPMPAAPGKDITLVNEKLARICHQQQYGFIDPQTAFAIHCRPITHPCFHPDGVHLTTRGYTTWAKAISTFLKTGFDPDEG